MTSIYALFICTMVGGHLGCQDHPAYTFATIEQCDQMKVFFEARGVHPVCMKRDVATWTPVE